MTHFSALQFDRLRLRELPPPAADELRAHLSTCAACTAKYDELAVPLLLPPLRRRLAWKWTSVFAAAAAAAAIAVVVNPGASTERRKGAEVSLGMYVQHDGNVRRAGPDEVVSPGDALRFTATSPGAYVAVLSLDPRGQASIYVPMSRVMSGTDIALPVATKLDESRGLERIFALFCDRPIDLEPIRSGLRSFSAPEGCQVVQWNFVKR